MSIHIEDLTVRFKNSVTAIDHADLDIPNGIFGLLGENGAGKTTLMRVLTTVLTSKQYVEGGLQLRVISEIQPELECMSIPATLEDAYIYVTNQYE